MGNRKIVLMLASLAVLGASAGGSAYESPRPALLLEALTDGGRRWSSDAAVGDDVQLRVRPNVDQPRLPADAVVDIFFRRPGDSVYFRQKVARATARRMSWTPNRWGDGMITYLAYARVRGTDLVSDVVQLQVDREPPVAGIEVRSTPQPDRVEAPPGIYLSDPYPSGLEPGKVARGAGDVALIATDAGGVERLEATVTHLATNERTTFSWVAGGNHACGSGERWACILPMDFGAAPGVYDVTVRVLDHAGNAAFTSQRIIGIPASPDLGS